MIKKFSVTYETITDESAEQGEAESSGFEAENVSLRDALSIIGGCEGGVEASECPVLNPRWFTFYKQNEDYGTGEVTNMSLHIPETVTRSSRLRIARLIGCYGLR
jgi:hypothetical protein